MARIATTSCDTASTGTGFLVDRNLVMTAAHVVRGAAAVSVTLGGQISSAEVLGRDDQADLALLRIPRPMQGHVFSFSSEDPSVGDEVAALGFPYGDPFAANQGRISSVNLTITNDFGPQPNVLQTDAAVNPGNSGGPLILLDGEVAGVISAKRANLLGDTEALAPEGIGYAVDAEAAAPEAGQWMNVSQPMAMAQCSSAAPVGPSDIEVAIDSTAPEAESIAQSLLVHGQAINRAAYDTAFAGFTQAEQVHMGGVEAWSSGLSTSFWRAISLENIAPAGGDAVLARVIMRSTQAPEDSAYGQTCSDWTLDYTMVPSGRAWLIDASNAPLAPVECPG